MFEICSKKANFAINSYSINKKFNEFRANLRLNMIIHEFLEVPLNINQFRCAHSGYEVASQIPYCCSCTLSGILAAAINPEESYFD